MEETCNSFALEQSVRVYLLCSSCISRKNYMLLAVTEFGIWENKIPDEREVFSHNIAQENYFLEIYMSKNS